MHVPARLLRLSAIAFVLCFTWLSRPAAGASPIVVASKKFPESVLLAEILAQALEQQGLRVVRKLNMGNTALVFENVKHGNVDIYPEYSGTAKQFLGGQGRSDARSVRRFVESELLRRHAIVWGPPLGFNNTYAIAVRSAFAKQHGLTSLSDLAEFSRRDRLRFVSTHEFLARADGFGPLSRAYGLVAEPKGVEHGLAYELLEQGQADATEVYATEGLIAAHDVTLLQDDLNYFPAYDASFLLGERVSMNPAVLAVVLSLAGRFDETRIRTLNHALEVEREPAVSVARRFLEQEGLGPEAPEADEPRPGVRRAAGFMERLWTDRARVTEQTLQHLKLTLLALLASALVGIPVGILAARRRWISVVALSGSNIVQTVPSLALLVFMIPIATALASFAGSDPMQWAALIALFLYGLLPIVRNTLDGVLAVSPAVLEAARGMGLTRGQLLRWVTLPLAAPFIVAGLRTSAVIGTGAATLAAFIGAGGLGEAIISGLSVQDYVEVLTGAVPAALLAIVLDLALGTLSNYLRRV